MSIFELFRTEINEHTQPVNSMPEIKITSHTLERFTLLQIKSYSETVTTKLILVFLARRLFMLTDAQPQILVSMKSHFISVIVRDHAMFGSILWGMVGF
jgi:hypothetical protein